MSARKRAVPGSSSEPKTSPPTKPMEIHDAMLPMLRDVVVVCGRRIWNQSDFFSTLNKLLTYEKRKWIFLPASLGGILRARPDARLCTRPDPLATRTRPPQPCRSKLLNNNERKRPQDECRRLPADLLATPHPQRLPSGSARGGAPRHAAVLSARGVLAVQFVPADHGQHTPLSCGRGRRQGLGELHGHHPRRVQQQNPLAAVPSRPPFRPVAAHPSVRRTLPDPARRTRGRRQRDHPGRQKTHRHEGVSGVLLVRRPRARLGGIRRVGGGVEAVESPPEQEARPRAVRLPRRTGAIYRPLPAACSPPVRE